MAEVDFVLQQGAEIIPIEVKEKSVKSRSLAEYRKKCNPTYVVRTSMVPELTISLRKSRQNVALGGLIDP
jgi:predicted AAA+ superfamily ATPase